MTGGFAAGLAQGMAEGFDTYVKTRERHNMMNNAYLQKVMGDLDVVGAVSDYNKKIMNDQVESLTNEMTDKLLKNKKLFGKPVIDTNYIIEAQKAVREMNQRFSAIKQQENLFARDYDIYTKDAGKMYDPEYAREAMDVFMKTGVYTPLLARKAVDKEAAIQAAMLNPPVKAEANSWYEGDTKVSALQYKGITDEQKKATLTNMFNDEGVRVGMTRDMINNGDINEIAKYYQVPPNNPAAWNKFQAELALIGAKKTIPGAGPISQLERDPAWQQAAYQYHLQNTAPKLFQDQIVGREQVKPKDPGDMSEREKFYLQQKKEEEAAAKKLQKETEVYSVTPSNQNPDGTTGPAIIFDKPSKQPTVSISTEDFDSMDGPRVPRGQRWNFKITNISDGYAYVEGNNPAVVQDPQTGEYTLSDKPIKYYGRVPVDKLKTQLKNTPGIKWGDIEKVATPKPSGLPDFVTPKTEPMRDPLGIF